MWRRPEEQIKEWVDDNITTPEILILDDLGSEKITEYLRTTFYYIFNEREIWERPTIITSNLSLEELDNHLGARVSSRIAGSCEVLKFTGKDRRLEK